MELVTPFTDNYLLVDCVHDLATVTVLQGSLLKLALGYSVQVPGVATQTGGARGNGRLGHRAPAPGRHWHGGTGSLLELDLGY